MYVHIWLHYACVLVSDLYWISTYEFAVVYSPPGAPSPDELPPQSSFVIVTASVSLPFSYLFILFLQLYKRKITHNVHVGTLFLPLYILFISILLSLSFIER